MAYHNKVYDFDMYDVTSGSYINKWDKRVTFTFSESYGSELTDYICNDFGWIIVSDNFKKAFEYDVQAFSSERFKKMIKNNKLTGFNFNKVKIV